MKKNYYSIHKNKKKRKSIRRSQIDTLRFLNAVNGFVYALMNLRSAMFGMMPIPKYKMSGNAELAILNDNILDPEVLEWKGEIHDFPYFDTSKKNKTFEM